MGTIWTLASVVIGIVLLLTLIIFLKLNTFISLIITSIVTAILLGMPLNKVMETIERYGRHPRSYCTHFWIRRNTW